MELSQKEFPDAEHRAFCTFLPLAGGGEGEGAGIILHPPLNPPPPEGGDGNFVRDRIQIRSGTITRLAQFNQKQ